MEGERGKEGCAFPLPKVMRTDDQVAVAIKVVGFQHPGPERIDIVVGVVCPGQVNVERGDQESPAVFGGVKCNKKVRQN